MAEVPVTVELIEPRRSTRMVPKKTVSAQITPPTKKGKRLQPEITAIPTLEVVEVTPEEVQAPPPSVEPPSEVDRSLTGITAEAKKLRETDPAKYGVKGAREGMPGYIKNGWKMALADAAVLLGCKSNASARQKRAAKVSMSGQQKLVKQAYLEELRLLQVKYFPLIGRKVSAKATKQAAKRAEEESNGDKN